MSFPEPARTDWRLYCLMLPALLTFAAQSVRASVIEFSGGSTTTSTDSEVYFSPLSGSVSNSYSSTALFGLGDVSGNLAIAFNTTTDGTLVIAPSTVNPSLSTVARLSPGDVVGPESTFDNTEYTLAESDGAIGNWNSLKSGYFGFSFGTAKNLHYGWADITVLPDYNVTLDEFAYETVAGQAITIPASVAPEPTSVLLVASAGLGLALFGSAFRRRRQAQLVVGVITALIVGSTVVSAQSAPPGPNDPMGSNLAQFRSDHIFATIAPTPADSSHTSFKTLGAAYPTDASQPITFNDTQYSSTVPYAGLRQYHAAAGRILQPDHDDMAVINGDGSNVDVQIVGHPELTVELPDLLSRYSAYGGKYLTVDFLALAVGDLDGAVDSNGNYHDEVAVAYVRNAGTGADGSPQGVVTVVVLDYSNSVNYSNGYPNSNGVTYQQPRITYYEDVRLLFNPDKLLGDPTQASTSHQILPFDNMLSISIGDFDGDGVREIAIGAVDFEGNNLVRVDTFRYRSEISQILALGGQDVPTTSVNGSPSYTALNVSVASGNFEDTGHDDLVLGFMEWNSTANPIPPFELYVASARFPINLLSGASTQQQTSVTVTPGNPTQLVINAPDGEVPHQITISGAPCGGYNPWCALNGTWRTTEVGRSNDGTGTFNIPLDSSSITAAVPTTLTLSLSSALAPVPGSSTYALMDPSDSSQAGFTPTVNLEAIDGYPRIQLVSGLFNLDPASGFTFTRREFAAVWNYPQFCTAQNGKPFCNSFGNLFPPDYRLYLGYFSTLPDSSNVPQIEGYHTAWFNPPTPTAQAAHRWDVAAGAFRGNGAVTSGGSFSAPPIWSVAINAWYDNNTEYLFLDEYFPGSGNNGSTNYVAAQEYNVNNSSGGERPAIAAYDPDGESAYLGTPVHFTITNLMTPIRILEEPVKELAWLNGQISNISRNDGFYTAFTDSSGQSMSSSTAATEDHDFAASEDATFSLQVKSDIGIGSNKFDASEELKFKQDNDHIESSFDSHSSEVTFSSTTQAISDDYLDFETQTLDVWRYRVYGGSGENQAAGTYPYYELTFPSAFVEASAPGTKVDWYNPVHENGNILSYPRLPSGGAPDDVNPNPYTVNGQPIGSNGLISGQCQNGVCNTKSYCISTGTSSTQQIAMTGVTSASSSVGWTKTNTYDTDTKVGDTVKFDYGFGNTVKLGFQLDLDFGSKQSWSQTSSSANTLTGSQSVLFQQDGSTVPYVEYPVLYDNAAGVLKFVHYVDIPTVGNSPSCNTNYWTQTYGAAPDPALNLPNRFTWSSYSKSSDTTTWALNQTLEREKVRGFSMNKYSALENDYIPVGANPQEGDTLQLAVRVYNYSVGANPANNVAVNFSAAPYDSSHDNELACGTPGSTEVGRYCPPVTRIPLGRTVIPMIPSWGQGAQNWQLATYNWTIPGGFATQYKTSEFRIYVNIEAYPGELNPPQKFCADVSANQACPALIGALSTDPNWDSLAPGQNNEGYAPTILTLAANTVQRIPVGGGILRSNVKVGTDSLQAVDQSGKLKGGLVVTYLGHPLSLRLRAISDGAGIDSQQQVFVYDGTGKNRTMIAGKMLPGISTKGSQAWFQWTPASLGLHELTARFPTPPENLSTGELLGRLKVIVVRMPGDVNGDGVVDARDTAIIDSQIGKRVSESSCGEACDLNGDGFIGRADLDLAMAHCSHAYCALPPIAKDEHKAIATPKTSK